MVHAFEFPKQEEATAEVIAIARKKSIAKFFICGEPAGCSSLEREARFKRIKIAVAFLQAIESNDDFAKS